MGHIYRLAALSNAEECIRLEGGPAGIRLPYMRGELQFLDQSELNLNISDQGGIDAMDVICQDGLLFVSDSFKQALDEEGIDYVYYKKANAASPQLGIYETYWLTLPPRLDCLNTEDSVFDRDWDLADGLIPMLRAEKVVILEKRLGRFRIFKIAGLADNDVYLTQDLYESLCHKDLDGAEYLRVQ